MTGFDLSPVIAALGFDAISIARRTRTFNSNGVLVEGTVTTIPMPNVSVQPLGASALAGATGKNVSQLPTGQRLHGAIIIYSKLEILVADPASGDLSDEVTWNGTVYSAFHQDPWVPHSYYRTVCLKKEG